MGVFLSKDSLFQKLTFSNRTENTSTLYTTSSRHLMTLWLQRLKADRYFPRFWHHRFPTVRESLCIRTFRFALKKQWRSPSLAEREVFEGVVNLHKHKFNMFLLLIILNVSACNRLWLLSLKTIRIERPRSFSV